MRAAAARYGTNYKTKRISGTITGLMEAVAVALEKVVRIVLFAAFNKTKEFASR